MKYFLVAFLSCLLLAGCLEEKKTHSTSQFSSSEKGYHSAEKEKKKKKRKKLRPGEISIIESPSAFDYYCRNADESIVVVESNAPDWLPDYLRMLQKQKPLLKVVLISSNVVCDDFCLEVDGLKASFALIDRTRLLVDPLYSEVSKGLTLTTIDPKIVRSYIDFCTGLLNGN